MKSHEAPPFLFFFALLTTLFLAIFYNTVTNMAGIYIASDLGGNGAISVYPMVFFGLGNALTIPLANPLADRFGPIRVLVSGLLFYLFFSTLCSWASTFFYFNVFRLGLGASSGLFYILCRRLLVALAPPEKEKAYGFAMVLMFAVVPVVGACFGAWLAYEGVWRWIFHINTPVACALAGYFWFGYRSLDTNPSYNPVDKTGYLFFVLGLGMLLSAATLAQQLDWYRSPTLVMLTLLGVPCFLFFLLWSWRCSHPILDLKLFKSPQLSFSLLNLGILFSSYFGMIILITLWLKLYANYTPLWISVLVGIMGVVALIAFLVSRFFPYKVDPRIPLGCSILFFASSCYYSTYFDVEVDFFHLAVARSLAGAGLVLFLLPLFELSMKSHSQEKGSAIFTLFQLTRTVSSSLGAALYVTLWQRRQAFFHERLGEGLTLTSSLTREFFRKATDVFYLTQEQATEQLGVFLNQHATSLALNDVFGCMGYILLGLFILLLFTFLYLRKLA